MRIVQISTYDQAGGAESSAYNLFEGYHARGHESYLLVGKRFHEHPRVIEIPNDRHRSAWAKMWMRIARGRLVSQLGPRGSLAVQWIGQPHRAYAWWMGHEDFHFPGTRVMLDRLPGPPDIIHCHNLHGQYFDLRQLPRLSRIAPLILNLRDAWLVSGHCAYARDCMRWRTGCGQCPYLGTYPRVRRDATARNWQRKRRIYQASRLYITAPSQWLVDRAKQSMLHGAMYKVIPNAINLEIFRLPEDRQATRLMWRNKLQLPSNTRIVLFTAHSEFKDYPMMVEALARFSSSTAEPDRPIVGLCVGAPAHLTSGPASCGHARLIHLKRVADPREMASLYHAADVYMHAAVDEAFGKMIAEAMATGIPVVATAVGGIPEIIEHGRTGLLTPVGDAQAMAQAVRQLLEDGSLAQHIAEQGSIAAHQNYNLQKQVQSFLDWYGHVCQNWQEHRHALST